MFNTLGGAALCCHKSGYPAGSSRGTGGLFSFRGNVSKFEEVAEFISYLADIAKASSERAGQAADRSQRQLNALEGLDSSAKSLTGVSDTFNQVLSRFRV
ncbi:hypothetical protein P4H71_12535 [Paenibacillus kribbensis]|uniref:hypothetical protein n=1 Tax=Paenibacillus kribbensis TaxID=172713 RepID=UPI002DBA817C|nr:hypothetical protein [Paenibacillus kribbensis]MEC0235157.1 hypothetical protein [Paenibacillus kribbensis]